MPKPNQQKENNTLLYVALGGAALLLVGAVVAMKFSGTTMPPPPPPPLPSPEASVTGTLRYTTGYYKAILDEDARRFEVKPATVEELAAPLVKTVELAEPRVLKAGEGFETAHLRFATSVVKAWAKGGSGQGFRYEHLVLSITNRTDAPLAYRVETSIDHPEKCRSQGAIGHNAIALAAGEKIDRTECLWHDGMTLTVAHAETIALPPIGFYYVSRLDPSQIGLDPRSAAGHEVPRNLKTCNFVPWRDIDAGGATWADVIDFYARHNCDEYTFYRGYRFRSTAGPLPAHEDKSAAAAPATAP
jgi:hypothetical protein